MYKLNLTSIVLIEEAKKLWLEIEIVSEKKSLFFIRWKWKEFLFKDVDFWWNSALWLRLWKDKELTYKILERNNFPIIKSLYLDKEKFISFDFSKLKNFNFPLIIKPVNWTRWKWVRMNILTLKELQKKLNLSFEKYNQMVIQEEIKWHDLRILVVKWKILLAIKRIPVNILWDWKNNIEKLIEIENKLNKYRWTSGKSPLTLIQINEELIEYIKNQNLTLESIPKKWKTIYLRWNANISTGGTMLDITTKISEDIKEKCIQISKIFWLEISWIDILIEDFTKSLKGGKGVILEINSVPQIGSHRTLTNVNTWKKILKMLFF